MPPASSAMTADPWERALDRFEAYLEQEEAALATGGPHAEAPPTPQLGPLPVHLGARAEALLQRSRELAALIESAALAVRRRLVDVRSGQPDQPSLFVDRLG